MTSSSSPLQSSSTVEEFIAALHQIVAKNDSCHRSEENVAIILTSKIQIIANNRTNQDLLQALGEFFMWMMPYTESLTGAERSAEEEQWERGTIICASRDFEELFVHQFLPYAKSSGAIYSLCRAVCLVALKPGNTYFASTVARDELLKLVKIAPCEKSLQWALRTMCNLAFTKKDGVPIEANPFICGEVSTVVYKMFCESTAPEIVQVAADLLSIQVANSSPQFYATDPDFVQKMLRKLDEATEKETVCSIATLIANVLYKKQSSMQFFSSSEAVRVFLSKLNSSDDPVSLRMICRCVNCAVCLNGSISHDFAAPEMCRAIFKCFSKQKDGVTKEIMHVIDALTGKLPRARSTFAQECPGLTQVLIATLTSAANDDTRRTVADVIANISLDDESAKLLFNNVAIYEALIHAACRAQEGETRKSLFYAVRNSAHTCTEHLRLCAARYPFHDERQIELLKLDSLDSLVSNLENSEWTLTGFARADFLSLRSILIVLEKIDQFLEDLDKRIEEGDERIEEMLLAIARGFSVMVRRYWAGLFGFPFFDVTLSLLERSSGAANAVFVSVIYNIVLENPNFTHPSTVLRLLQKLDSSKELRDREYNDLKMEFHIYEILETAARRNPELFRENNFLVDNSALIRSCFERSFEIHEFDANAKDNKRLEAQVEALYKIDPRMKEILEGWDRSVRNVA